MLREECPACPHYVRSADCCEAEHCILLPCPADPESDEQPEGRVIHQIIPFVHDAPLIFTNKPLGKFRDVVILDDSLSRPLEGIENLPYLLGSISRKITPNLFKKKGLGYSDLFYRQFEKFGFSDADTFQTELDTAVRDALSRGNAVYATHVKQVTNDHCCWCRVSLLGQYGRPGRSGCVADDDGDVYCSFACKMEMLKVKSCSISGVRPTVPGAWEWTCRQVDLRDGNHCRLCGSGDKLEYHHLIPISAGGNSLPENLCKLCHDCHMKVHGALKRPDTTEEELP